MTLPPLMIFLAASRRRFINWLLGTGAGGLLAAVGYPVARYLTPPGAGEAVGASVTLATPPGDLELGSATIFRFGTQPGILIRTPEGDLRAFSAVCTHLGCIVQYRSDLSHIWCACHNGHFDLNGRNIAGPPPRPLDEYVVHEQADEIIVSRQS